MTFKLGLTGSIGMGKSTTAEIFADFGCAIWDADQAVRRLYSKDGAAVIPISDLCPDVIQKGAVSREKLKHHIASDPELLSDIEKIVHPLVAKDRSDFLKATQADIAVFDIPLLFENGTQSQMDAVICVTTDSETQKKRVLERGTMTEEQFYNILNRQMPDKEKRKRADYVITTNSIQNVRNQVEKIIADIRIKLGHKSHHA